MDRARSRLYVAIGMSHDTLNLNHGISPAPPGPLVRSEVSERLARCYRQISAALLAQRNARGHWEGELSASALSTATAVMALEMVRRGGGEVARSRAGPQNAGDLIEAGVKWIAERQNVDGGWGDT